MKEWSQSPAEVDSGLGDEQLVELIEAARHRRQTEHKARHDDLALAFSDGYLMSRDQKFRTKWFHRRQLRDLPAKVDAASAERQRTIADQMVSESRKRKMN